VGLFSEPDLNQMGAEWLGEWVKRPGYEFADGELEAIGLGHLLPFIEASPRNEWRPVPCAALLGEWQADTHSFERLTSKMSADDGGAIMPTTLLPPQGWDTSLCGGVARENCTKTALHQQSVTELV